MERRSLRDRVAAIAALDEPIRRRLLEHVRASERAVSRDAAAEALGLRRSTAAFHLDRLVREGLLAVDYRRLSGRSGPGAGRPAKLYRRGDAEVSVSVPERHYDLAAHLLAQAVDESARTGRPVREVLLATAHDAGREIGAAHTSLRAALDDLGFEPQRDREGDLVLRNCPFYRLAREHTELVCHTNLALLSGVAEGAGDTQSTTVLDPGDGRCCVRVRHPG